MPDGDRANLDLKLRKQTRDLMMQGGIRSVATLDLPPGRYQLRVAAREANNGSLGPSSPISIVPDFSSEPLSMSGILLSSSGAQLTPTPRMVEEFKKLLPAPPTTTRGFATVESIFGYVDVYDSLQPAHSTDITTTVTRVDGTKVFTTTEERKSSEFGGLKGGGFGAQFEVPLKEFAPGLYVLKVEAKPRLDKQPVSRELTFAVYGPPTAGTTASATRIVPIAHGPLSNGSTARESVVRNPEDWNKLWASLPTKQAAPQVAFDQMMVVGVFVGNRPTTGYKVEITGARKEGDTLVIQWREVPPADRVLGQRHGHHAVCRRRPAAARRAGDVREGGQLGNAERRTLNAERRRPGRRTVARSPVSGAESRHLVYAGRACRRPSSGPRRLLPARPWPRPRSA